MEMTPKLFVAVKAFINHRGKILILRESGKYLEGTNQERYDLPGGRINPGESFKEALLREIREETGLEVKIGRAFSINEWRPTVKGEKWQIVGTFIECHSDSDSIVLSKDHSHYEWINPRDYEKYPIIATNIPAFIDYISLKR